MKVYSLQHRNLNFRAFSRLSCLSILFIAIYSSSNLSVELAIAQQPSPPKKESKPAQQDKRSPNPPLIDAIIKFLQPQKRSGGSTNMTMPSTSWSTDWPHFKDRPIELDGRGSQSDETVRKIGFCISPTFDQKERLLWTRQPLIAWAKQAKSLELIDTLTLQTIWQRKDLSDKVPYLKLNAPVLANRNYYLRLVIDDYGVEQIAYIDFQTVSETQWQQIDRDLTEIEKEGIRARLSPERVILQKAEYFAKHQLWGDLQSTVLSYRENNPKIESSELKNILSVFDEGLKDCTGDRPLSNPSDVPEGWRF
jgi:hypothetical protein